MALSLSTIVACHCKFNLKNSFLEDNKTLSICFIVCIKLFKVKPCKCKAPNIFKQRKKNFNGSEKKEYKKFTKFIK